VFGGQKGSQFGKGMSHIVMLGRPLTMPARLNGAERGKRGQGAKLVESYPVPSEALRSSYRGSFG
jgi:hypothetical protein